MARVPAWAHLREAEQAAVSCATCDFFERDTSTCGMFDHAPVEAGDTCDEWQSRVDKEGDLTGGSPQSFDPAEVRGMADLVAALEPDQVAKAEVKAAGIAVRARDTGRVLMIQRSLADPGDKAAGTWEFPGGKLEPGEHAYTAAKREWQEEMGVRLPAGGHAGEWRSGVYHGFIHDVPEEGRVKLNLDPEDRRVMNPDDPDGDQIEVAAWFHPDHLKRMSSLRPELRASRPWRKVAKAGEGAVYLVSHAKTRYNRPGQPHDLVHGWRNTPLDSTGHRQAKALGRFLAGVGIDELHSSDLARASQTAAAVGDATGTKPQVAGKYRPWNLGDFAGHSSADVIPKLKPYMGEKSGQPVDGGESFDEFKNRFIPALEALLKKAEAGKSVALVTHSRNIELAQGWLNGAAHRKQIDTRAITADRIDPGTVIKVSRDSRTGKMLPAELDDETVRKGTARAAELRLRVHGVSTTPSGMRVYRMVTRDGHYVGRTNATRVRARKGDVLKIAANDLLADNTGDIRWQNPNVVGAAIHDTPHSWRELEAFAGGPLVKDGAPGPAGDLPPATGDTPEARFPSGPTLEAVHVDAPLPNISVAYANRRMIPRPAVVAQVAKMEPMKQLVYGVVLEPNSLDSQNDYMLPASVEKTAHGYLKRAIRGSSNVMKLQHRRQGFKKGKPSLVPVESFIAPVDFTYDGKETIKKGSWVLVVHVEDPGLWQDFLDRKYNAFSVGGHGVRQSLTAHPDVIPGGWMTAEPAGYQSRLAARGLNNFV